MPASYFNYWGKAGSKPENGDPVVYHLLPYHNLDVAAVGSVYLRRFADRRRRWSDSLRCSDDEFSRLCLFMLAHHDIGKFAAGFQGLRSDVVAAIGGSVDPQFSYPFRHDTIGHLIWRETDFEEHLLSVLGLSDLDDGQKDYVFELLQEWSHGAVGHHGVPPHSLDAGRLHLVASRSRDLGAVLDYSAAVAELFDPRLPWTESGELRRVLAAFRRISWSVAGMTVLCDWMGSSERDFGYAPDAMKLSDYWEKRALPAAEKAMASSGLIPARAHVAPTFDHLFPQITLPSPLQEAALAVDLPHEPAIVILEDLTGSGKTEAAAALVARMMSAGSAKGMYVALPTMATANAMFERLAAFYRRIFEAGESPSLVLAHGARRQHEGFRNSILTESAVGDRRYGDGEEASESTCALWLAQGMKKALLAQVGVGTVDQALLGVLRIRHQSLRLLGLEDKVLVVDEVHACDEYMVELLSALIRRQSAAGGSVVLLSATLPGWMRHRFLEAFGVDTGVTDGADPGTPFPLLTAASRNAFVETSFPTRGGCGRQLGFELVDDEERLKKMLLTAAARGRCVCWVRNTVADAVKAVTDLKARNGDLDIDLVHARFTAADRLERERDLLDRFGPGSTGAVRRGRIVVATQVVEQSLDLDFDEMFSDLAPLDLLLQRAGRLRRHFRNESGDRVEVESRSGEPVLHVLGPTPGPADGESWLDDLIPKTKYVYTHHGHLWRTAVLIRDEGRIRLPEDSRRWIESVFGQDTLEGLPDGLEAAALTEDGIRRAEASIARMSVIDEERGYAPHEVAWEEDADAMTRLGERQILLRLIKNEDGRLSPWRTKGPDPWAGGDLRLRVPGFTGVVTDVETEELLASLSEGDPGASRFANHCPVRRCEDGVWRAELTCSDSGRRLLEYREDRGAAVL